MAPLRLKSEILGKFDCQFLPLFQRNWRFYDIFVKNSLWNWRSLIKIPNKYNFIWSYWINNGSYNQSQVIYLETNPITNVKLTHVYRFPYFYVSRLSRGRNLPSNWGEMEDEVGLKTGEVDWNVMMSGVKWVKVSI